MEQISSGNDRRILLVVFALTFVYLIVEIVVGLLANSLALIADAVHMFTDAGALALAAFASWMVEKPSTPEKTYGYYRVEILAALANALILTAGAAFIIYEAYRRFQQPGQVIGLPMMVTALAGLAINLIGLWLFRSRSSENLNMRAAFYEVIKDALGSVGVIVAGAVIVATDFTLVDPIVSLLIAVFILPRTWNLFSEAVNILLETTPAHISTGAVRQAMKAVQGVDTVHDLHVWTITSGLIAMSGHIVLEAGVDRKRAQEILTRVSARLKEDFDIQHTTIQVEFQDIQASEPEL
jgi:cobalt-zinc-cadmium efflux system protein